jgi:hypothetical protein
MSAKKSLWKVRLRRNPLAKEAANDYIADVSTVGKTLRNEDIVQIMKKEGSELQPETLLYILNRADRLCVQKVREGYSVRTGLAHVTPRVLGAWRGNVAHFDPAVHRITAGLAPSLELRSALETVGVEVVGLKGSGAIIGLVTDLATGATDGTLTVGDDLMIEGEKIRLAPDDDPLAGIFFIDADGAETPVTHRLRQNDPKKIIARVPLLSPGAYTLEIRTRFSQGAVFLKEIAKLSLPPDSTRPRLLRHIQRYIQAIYSVIYRLSRKQEGEGRVFPVARRADGAREARPAT